MSRYIGTEIANALDTCGATHSTDNVLTVDPADATKLKSQKTQTANIADNAVTGAKSTAYSHFFHGDGSDGAAAFDGSNAVTGCSRSGTTYTLSRDVFYSSMTVSTGVTIVTGLYRLGCSGTATLQGTSVIHNDGSTGASGSGQTAGVGVVLRSQGTIGGPIGGASGGTGGANGANGSNGSNGGATAPSRGGNGASGGVGKTGESGGHTGGTAGSGGTVSLALESPRSSHFVAWGHRDAPDAAGVMKMIYGGASGGGGSGGGGGAGINQLGGGGGAGGDGAGSLVFSADTISISGWTGRISANGGKGGDGGSGTGTGGTRGGGGGGGAGGGGGVCVVIARVVTGGTLTSGSNVTATGGTAGAAGSVGSGGTSAGNGSDGTVVIYIG